MEKYYIIYVIRFIDNYRLNTMVCNKTYKQESKKLIDIYIIKKDFDE